MINPASSPDDVTAMLDRTLMANLKDAAAEKGEAVLTAHIPSSESQVSPPQIPEEKPETTAKSFAAASAAEKLLTPAEKWAALTQAEKNITLAFAHGGDVEPIIRRQNIKRAQSSKYIKRLEEKLGFKLRAVDTYLPSRELLAFVCAVPLDVSELEKFHTFFAAKAEAVQALIDANLDDKRGRKTKGFLQVLRCNLSYEGLAKLREDRTLGCKDAEHHIRHLFDLDEDKDIINFCVLLIHQKTNLGDPRPKIAPAPAAK